MTDMKSDELRMLTETVERFAADHAQHAQADNALWEQMAELGLLTLPFSEENGGMGTGVQGINIMMQAIGSAGLNAPFLPYAVMAGGITELCGTRPELIDGIMNGESRIAVGLLSAGTQDSDGKRLVQATAAAQGFALNGEMSDILALDQADKIIVAATMPDNEGKALFLVDLGAPEITVTTYPLIDGRMAGKIRFADAVVTESSCLAKGNDYINCQQQLESRVLLAVASQNYGNLHYLYSQTLEYAKLRKQFGRAIGSFQSLQFRIVDMWIKLEEARTLIAAAVLSEGTESFNEMAKAAWIQSLWSARLISEEAIQIHGAIAMTEEFAIGSFVKTLLVNEYLFGSADHHLPEYQPDLIH